MVSCGEVQIPEGIGQISVTAAPRLQKRDN
jgi:hypothetical protein